MRIKEPHKRLQRFWGKVDRKHIDVIQRFLRGPKLLDIGSGYGTTTAQLTAAGFDCVGVDYDQQSIQFARMQFPNCKYRQANAEDLPFDDGTFDTIVLRDALHHLYGEANFAKVKSEIVRVAKPRSRIIFFDPNVNSMLRLMRLLSAHRDEECQYETARNIMRELGYSVIHSSFNTVYSLPLSGGYVGIDFTPNLDLIHSCILESEKLAETAIRKLGLERFLCWRYLIVGDVDGVKCFS